MSKRCQRCEGQGYVVGPRGGLLAAQLCGCVACDCDEGYQYETDGPYEYVVPCPRCGGNLAMIRRLERATIPAEFASADLEGWCPSTSRGVTLRKRLLEVTGPKGLAHGFCLLGPPGTGKTWLLVAVIRRLLHTGLTCRFAAVRDFLAECRTRIESGTLSDFLGYLRRVDVLVLDELGAWRSGDRGAWDRELVGDLIEARYSTQRVTMATSNLEPAELECAFGDAGSRILSRMAQTMPFLRLSGADRRRSLKVSVTEVSI